MKSKISCAKAALYGCMTAVALGLLFSPVAPIDPASAAKASARDSAQRYKVGDQVVLRYPTALYSEPLTAAKGLRSFQAQYYGTTGDSHKVHAAAGEMVALQTMSRGIVWLPSWYLSNESGGVKELAPSFVKLKAKTNIHLTPGSLLKWPGTSSSADLTAVAQWKDWYGVLVSPKEWHKDYMVYVPAMMWVRGTDIESKKTIPEGILDADSSLPTEVTRELTSYLLKQGDSASPIRKLLGKPHHKEKSANLQMKDNGPLQLGETWRYERPGAQFSVTFSAAGQLKRTHWVLPSDDGYQANRNAGDHYSFTYDFVTTPLARTIAEEPVWRHQGELAYTYLIGANEDVLLLKGDDGGFSGMHHNSSIYALDRATGRKLWQQDMGFGGFTAKMDGDRKSVTVYSGYNPDKKQYEDRIRRVRLSDGKVLWEVKPPKHNGIDMTSARHSILVFDIPDSTQGKGTLSVLDSETGKERWKKALSGDYRILNQGTEDPYVLIQQNGEVKAYDPANGKTAWSFKVQGPQMEDPARDPYYTGGYRSLPLSPADGSARWMLLGREWKLVDLQNGKAKAVYPAAKGERFEVLDDRYLLVHHGTGGTEDYYGAKAYETVLFDAVEQRKVWTLKGRGTKGVMEGDTIYMALNGFPAAVEAMTGKVRWVMPASSKTNEDLSHLASSSFAVLDRYLLLVHGHDLLVLGKEDGKVLGRVHDVYAGSAELRELDARNGSLNAEADELYAGTANGSFIRYDAKALEKRLDGLDE